MSNHLKWVKRLGSLKPCIGEGNCILGAVGGEKSDPLSSRRRGEENGGLKGRGEILGRKKRKKIYRGLRLGPPDLEL